MLFNNVTIRLVGSDDLSEAGEHRALTDIAACLRASFCTVGASGWLAMQSGTGDSPY
jgi:hypothetical protein